MRGVTIGGTVDGGRGPLGCGWIEGDGIEGDGMDPFGTLRTGTVRKGASKDGRMRCGQWMTCEQGRGTIPKRMQDQRVRIDLGAEWAHSRLGIAAAQAESRLEWTSILSNGAPSIERAGKTRIRQTTQTAIVGVGLPSRADMPQRV